MGPLVETRDGRVAGTREGDLSVFRGIPFARPPVGELRFAPPSPPAPWTGVREASAFGPAAPQPTTGVSSLPGFGADETSEDCLTLNVWTPALDGRRPASTPVVGR